MDYLLFPVIGRPDTNKDLDPFRLLFGSHCFILTLVSSPDEMEELLPFANLQQCKQPSLLAMCRNAREESKLLNFQRTRDLTSCVEVKKILDSSRTAPSKGQQTRLSSCLPAQTRDFELCPTENRIFRCHNTGINVMARRHRKELVCTRFHTEGSYPSVASSCEMLSNM